MNPTSFSRVKTEFEDRMGLRCMVAAWVLGFCSFDSLVGQESIAFAPSKPAEHASSEWPFIRGPNFDGHSTDVDLADAWPASGPPVLWSRELGQGFSSFVAWEGRVATQFQSLGGQYVVCLDARSGRTLWKYRYGWPYDPSGVYPGPRATPTYAKGRLYFAAPDGLIGCLRAQDGTLLWSRDVKREFSGEGTDFGYSCAPTVVNDKVLLPVGGPKAAMVVLSARDGSVLWRSGDDAASYTPAYPISFDNRSCVIGYLQNALVLYDLETGERIWRKELSAGYDEHSAWPIYREPYLWISSPFQAGSELLELTGDPAQPVRSVWKSERMSNDIFSSVLVDGALYGFDLLEAQAKTHRPSRGQFRCLDFLTGKEHWSIGSPRRRRSWPSSAADAGKRVGHATVIAADGKLILMNDTGELILARATTRQYEELDRVSLLGGELCWTQPALHRRCLFVRNHSRAACIFLGKANALDPPLRSQAITPGDIPQTRYVDVAALVLGIEPEYAFDLPSNEWLRNWFAVCCGIVGIGAVVVYGAHWIVGRPKGSAACRWSLWLLVFVLGSLGTTYISSWQNDFVFTWPLAIFALFQLTVCELRVESQGHEKYVAWRSVLATVLFVAVSIAYFLLCRRLSLVFEWVFLCGFVPALPFSWAAAFWFWPSRWRAGWEGVMSVVAFSVFYWSAVAVLLLRP